MQLSPAARMTIGTHKTHNVSLQLGLGVSEAPKSQKVNGNSNRKQGCLKILHLILIAAAAALTLVAALVAALIVAFVAALIAVLVAALIAALALACASI